MNRIRLILHRLFRRPTITGPTRIYVRRIPAGVMLDLEHFLTDRLTAIADDPDLLALLLEIADQRGTAGEYDGWAPEQLLMERLLSGVGYEVPVYGDAVAALADRLRAVAPAPVASVPAQRREGGAAA
ncbi:hypothetical protein [Streptomyces sp. TOR3209]|uniref:hypothetical protein n=1 Tax=Streptomyces sp. TOR3209 TaxID=1073567 RepID=UPI0002D5F340|nr:hypothetical protein [Streptomyces sp. TOR3209]